MKVGDIVYIIYTRDARLKGQGDGVEMYEATIKSGPDNELYAQMTKLVSFIGSKSYSEPGSHSVFTSIGSMTKAQHELLFYDLSKAKQHMMSEIFKKKEWHTPMKVL